MAAAMWTCFMERETSVKKYCSVHSGASELCWRSRLVMCLRFEDTKPQQTEKCGKTCEKRKTRSAGSGRHWSRRKLMLKEQLKED